MNDVAAQTPRPEPSATTLLAELRFNGVTELANTISASIAAFTPTTVPAGQIFAFLGNSA